MRLQITNHSASRQAYKFRILKTFKDEKNPSMCHNYSSLVRLNIENSFCVEAGFSMLELLSVMAIIILLSGYVTFSLVKAQQHTSSHAAIDTLVSDLKQQQLSAMIDTTQGNGTQNPQGIYFQQGSYILFSSSVYSPADPSNFTVALDSNLQFTNITFPNSSIIFAKGSGEFSNFITGDNTVQIKNTSSGEIKTLTINKYGTITSVN